MLARPVPFAWLARACGPLLLVALLLGPAPGALAGTQAGLAAPAVTLDPASGPCPTGVTVRGSGFAPGVTVAVSIRRDRDGAGMGGPPVPGGPPVAADGTLDTRVVLSGCGPNDPAGSTFTVTASEYHPGNTPVFGPEAAATFTVTASQPTGATVTLDPPRGPCSTRVVASGVGFTPDVLVSYVLTRDSDGMIIAHSSSGGGEVTSSTGSFTKVFPRAGCDADAPIGSTFTYAFYEHRPDGTPVPGMKASATFTVAAPGLPNTGGGGGATPVPAPTPIALLALGLLGAGGLARRRRAARQRAR